MGWLSWIVLGAVAGWIASVITGRNRRMGLLMTVLVGVLGALIGGFVASWAGYGTVTGLNWRSLIVATLGAVVLLLLTGWRRKR